MCLQRDAITVHLLNRDCVRQMASDWQDGLPRPGARLYGWLKKTDEFADGRVRAKVAVADGKVCFITSANLTGYAMERNIEAGILDTGGVVARGLNDHLRSLVDTGVISPV